MEEDEREKVGQIGSKRNTMKTIAPKIVQAAAQNHLRVGKSLLRLCHET